MQSFDHYRFERFPAVYAAVTCAHEESARSHHGHGLDHDVAVAMMAVRLAGTDEFAAERAFVSGMLHSVDHYAESGHMDTELDRLLGYVELFIPDRNEIREAVKRHTENRTAARETRSVTQQLLMDADKLINMNLLVVFRAGQFRPGIPAIDYRYLGSRHPEANYRSPPTGIEDLYGCIEWGTEPGWFHTPEGQRLGALAARKLLTYIEDVEFTFAGLGLAGVEL